MKLALSISVLLLCGLPALAQVSAVRSEFQEWNEVQLIIPLKQEKDKKGKTFDRFSATLSGILRLGQKDLRAAVDSRAGLTLDYRLNKFVHFYGAYQYRTDEPLPRTRGYEQRLAGALGLERTWKKFT